VRRHCDHEGFIDWSTYESNRQSSITIGFEALCGGDSGLDPKRRDRGKHGARNRFVDLYGTDVEDERGSPPIPVRDRTNPEAAP
jgi:hypothetical protein